jgi:hypothetical protein
MTVITISHRLHRLGLLSHLYAHAFRSPRADGQQGNQKDKQAITKHNLILATFTKACSFQTKSSVYALGSVPGFSISKGRELDQLWLDHQLLLLYLGVDLN